MTEPPEDAASLPNPPAASEIPPGRRKGSTLTFILGVFLGLIGTIVPAAFIAMIGMGARGRALPIVICAVELICFFLVGGLALRSKRQGLIQGVIVGGALAFLLCAACWGLMAGSGLFRT